MTAIALKKRLHETIDTVENTTILEAVYAILDQHKTAMQLKPMSEKEFYDRIEKSEKEIAEGKLIDHKDVKKYIRKLTK